MGFVLRRAAFTIAGAGRDTVAEVIDAHLEMLSMIVLTTIWATVYAWFEGTAEDVGKWFYFYTLPWPLSLLGIFSTYHLVLGVTVFAISFSFGFLKFTRMLWARKRYLMFTALGNYPYALVLEDFLYFFFSVPYARLTRDAWTCSILSLGCAELKMPWTLETTLVLPYWYFVALAFSACMFFLAYRSALVNLLVTRQIMKEAGIVEKVRIPQPTPQPQALSVAPTVLSIPVDTRPSHIPAKRKESASSPGPTPPPAPEEIKPESKKKLQATRIVEADREEFVRRLREHLERGG